MPMKTRDLEGLSNRDSYGGLEEVWNLLDSQNTRRN